MEKSLTPVQADKLEKALPAGFKALDAEFHERAERLAAAAATHDPELVAYQYSRLLENCTRCHAAYARHRFPGFTSPVPTGHGQ
jgi:cytochrome c556